MKGSIIWRFLLTIALVGWTVSSIFPVKDSPLREFLVSEAKANKEDFVKLLDRAKVRGEEMDKVELAKNPKASRTSIFLSLKEVLKMEKDSKGQPYELSKFFPQYNVRGIKALEKRNVALLKHLLMESQGKLKLGLDLNGGVAVTYQIKQLAEEDEAAKEKTSVSDATKPEGKAPAPVVKINPQEIEKALEIIKERVDAFGLAEPVVRLIGDDRIELQLPGVSTSQNPKILEDIAKPAVLQFCEVSSQRASPGDKAPPGFRLASLEHADKKGNLQTEWLFIGRVQLLGGDSIKRASARPDPTTGEPYISFEMNSDGAKQFGAITTRLIGQRFAIVLDKKVVSAPTIQSAIVGGSGQITGSFSEQEAQELANTLNNPLKVGLEITDLQEVAPNLASDSKEAAVRACYIGAGIVVSFMVAYYYGFAAGLVAAVSLFCSMVIIIGTMCGLGASFSLPAIGALVLTVGMAVDAQILIYERMREELDVGKSIGSAVKAGFEKAFSTIVDANLTTLLTAVILIASGSGPVKGFGFTLTIGIVATVFSALITTRALMELYLVSKAAVYGICGLILGGTFVWLLMSDSSHWLELVGSLVFGGVLAACMILLRRMLTNRKGSINFLKFAKPALLTTWSVVALGIVGVFMHWNTMWGIDFVGGDEYRLSYDVTKLNQNGQPLAAETIVQKIATPANKFGEINASFTKVLGGDVSTLKLQTETGKGKTVVEALSKAYPEANFKVVGNFSAGPSFGAKVKQDAIVSMLLAVVGIMIYVGLRFEWGYGVGALVSTVHDVLMTVGIYVLLGGQFSGAMIAAILMIVGYSINDTIVVFDRIREELEGNRGLSLAEIINKATTVTLGRTILTSATTLFSTAALYVFGVGIVQDFALIFLIGIVTGTFSSIFVASPIFYFWHKGDRSDVEASKDILPSYEWESGGPAPKGKGKSQPILEGDTGA